ELRCLHVESGVAQGSGDVVDARVVTGGPERTVAVVLAGDPFEFRQVRHDGIEFHGVGEHRRVDRRRLHLRLRASRRQEYTGGDQSRSPHAVSRLRPRHRPSVQKSTAPPGETVRRSVTAQNLRRVGAERQASRRLTTTSEAANTTNEKAAKYTSDPHGPQWNSIPCPMPRKLFAFANGRNGWISRPTEPNNANNDSSSSGHSINSAIVPADCRSSVPTPTARKTHRNA